MKTLSNQRGYALLIVLLTIIIFLSVSAVFISASLNHVTQEKTVDLNNQAVVAGEMGVKYAGIKLDQEINNLYAYHKSELERKINELSDCDKQLNSLCNNEDKIIDLEEKEINLFKNSIYEKYAELETYTIKISDETQFYLDPNSFLQKDEIFNKNSNETSYNLPFIVNGQVTKTSQNSKLIKENKNLYTNINVPIPNFISKVVSENTAIPKPGSNDSHQLNRYFFDRPISQGNCKDLETKEGLICVLLPGEKIDDVLDGDLNLDYSKISILAENINTSLCDTKGKSSNCEKFNKSKVYVKNNIDISKISNLRNIALFLDGTLEFKHGINFSGFAVVKNLATDHHLKNVYGNILVTGDNLNKVTVTIDKHIGSKNLGKLCFNLDGINVESSKLGSKGEGNVYYFSSNSEVTMSHGEKYSDTYESFVKYCLQDNNLPNPQPVKELTPIYVLINNENEITVEYINPEVKHD